MCRSFFNRVYVQLGRVCIICVLVTVSIAAVKQHGLNSAWVGKDIFGLYFHTINHHCRKSVQELKQGSHLEVGLLNMTCSACTHHNRSDLLHQSLIKKKGPTGLTVVRSYGSIFLIEFPSSQIILAAQVDINLCSTICYHINHLIIGLHSNTGL